jgi:hypothetical protein
MSFTAADKLDKMVSSHTAHLSFTSSSCSAIVLTIYRYTVMQINFLALSSSALIKAKKLELRQKLKEKSKETDSMPANSASEGAKGQARKETKKDS